jgi:hypothetical protein
VHIETNALNLIPDGHDQADPARYQCLERGNALMLVCSFALPLTPNGLEILAAPSVLAGMTS